MGVLGFGGLLAYWKHKPKRQSANGQTFVWRTNGTLLRESHVSLCAQGNRQIRNENSLPPRPDHQSFFGPCTGPGSRKLLTPSAQPKKNSMIRPTSTTSQTEDQIFATISLRWGLSDNWLQSVPTIAKAWTKYVWK